jgi:hypothetical protein
MRTPGDTRGGRLDTARTRIRVRRNCNESNPSCIIVVMRRTGKYTSFSRSEVNARQSQQWRSRLVGAAFAVAFVALTVRAFWGQGVRRLLS